MLSVMQFVQHPSLNNQQQTVGDAEQAPAQSLLSQLVQFLSATGSDDAAPKDGCKYLTAHKRTFYFYHY